MMVDRYTKRLDTMDLMDGTADEALRMVIVCGLLEAMDLSGNIAKVRVASSNLVIRSIKVLVSMLLARTFTFVRRCRTGPHFLA